MSLLVSREKGTLSPSCIISCNMLKPKVHKISFETKLFCFCVFPFRSDLGGKEKR